MALTDFLFGSNKTGDLLEKFTAELEGMGPSGLSQLERQKLLADRERTIRKRAETKSARSSASLARRGVKSPGILTNLFAKIGTQAAGDVSLAESDILGQSLEIGRRKKGRLQQLIAMLAGQADQGGLIPSLVEAGGAGLGTYLGRKL